MDKEQEKIKLELVKCFKEFSTDTWKRLVFTRFARQIKTNEVTLTQNLIYKCYLLSKELDLPIEVYEAKNENANGNDIELAIETKKGYILFPTQAKIIKHNNKYPSARYMVKGVYQLDLLKRYAKANMGIPLYLFYNVLDEIDTLDWEEKLETEKIEFYGSTFVDFNGYFDHAVKDNFKIPSFWDIHPRFGIPIHELIQILFEEVTDCKLFNPLRFNIRYYSKKEVKNSFDGINITSKPISGIGNAGHKKAINNNTLFNRFKMTYNPRYQIIISKKIEPRGSGIIISH